MPVGVFPMADSEIRAGKLAHWGALSYSVNSGLAVTTDTGDGDPTYSHQANGFTLFAPDAIDLSVGLNLIAESSFDGTSGTWDVFYDGPCAPFGGWSTGGSTYRSGVSIEARLTNVRLYAMETGALLRIMFDSVELYVNGGLAVTLGPPVDATSAGVGPNYVPIVGIPLWVYRSCGCGRTNTTPWTYDPCNPDNAGGRDWETAVAQTVSGGWRWQEGGSGTWLDAPVSPYAGSATRTYGDLLSGTDDEKYQFSYAGRVGLVQDVTFTCDDGDDGPPTVIGGGSGGAVGIDPCTGSLGPAYRDVYETHTESHAVGDGDVLLDPNLAKDLKRLASGYAKLLRRLWFPQTKATSTSSDTEDGVTTGSTTVTTVHPALGNDFLGLLRDGDHAVLDFLDTPAYAPSTHGSRSATSTSYINDGTHAIQCPNPGTELPDCAGALGIVCNIEPFMPAGTSSTIVSSVAFPTFVGDSGDYQGHAEPIARYLATWPNPFWHLFDHRQDWYLQGSNAPWASGDDPGYWGPIRDQWLDNGDLPGGERAKTRSAMIGSPYYDSAYTPVFDEFTAGLPWNGVSRWKVREVAFPEILTLTADSLPMLSCPDGSCTVAISGGNVVVTPAGSGPCVVDVDLVRADCFPFYGLLLAKKAKLGTYGNVDTITAALRSSFGRSIDLNDGDPLAASTEYPFPRGTDSGYAGTWGLNEGNGYLADQGTDVALGGDSIGHMANPETVAGFQGIRGLQGSVLRLTVTPSGSGDVTIGLPTFRRFQGHPEVRWLDGNKAALLWPDGPAILWGAHLTYVPDEGLHWPWIPKALGVPNSLADALQFVYAIFECTDPGDVAAFDAECNAWYDDFEVSLRNVGSADKFSFSFLLPKGTGETIRFAIVQTVAEVPPLACFPTRARAIGTWLDSGDPSMERWDQAQETKYVVSPVEALELRRPDGTPVSTPGAAPSGWAVQECVLPLTGDEGGDFMLTQGSTTVATVRPYRGWLFVGGFPSLVKGLHLIASPPRLFHLVAVGSVDLVCHTFDLFGRRITVPICPADRVQNAQVAFNAQGFLLVAVGKGDGAPGVGTVELVESHDWGRHWGTSSHAFDGTYPALASDASGNDFLLVWESGGFRLRFRPRGGAWVDQGLALPGLAEGRATLAASRGASPSLLAMTAGDLYERRTPSGGFTKVDAPGSHPDGAIALGDADGARLMAYWESGKVKARRRLDPRLPWEDPVDVLSVDETTCGAAYHTGAQGAVVVALVKAGDVARRVSLDRGASWGDA